MNILYRTFFKLTAAVNDFEAAREYLLDDDMTVYLLEDDRCTSFKDKIKSIKWILSSESSGYIDLETTSELTDIELETVSDWVSGQNSDGLGEGFEQQDFAFYKDEGLVGYDGADWDDEYIEASFDWETNSYKFELISQQ